MLSLEPIVSDLQPCWVCVILLPNSRSLASRTSTPPGTFTAIYKFMINSLPFLFPDDFNPLTRPSLLRRDLYDLELQSALVSSEDRTSTILEVPMNQRRARLSLTAHAHHILIRKRTRRWHAALAGAVSGGVAVLFEIRSRRIVIGQQMFVRFVNHFLALPTSKSLYGDISTLTLPEGCRALGMPSLRSVV
jgi:hypothetical protein